MIDDYDEMVAANNPILPPTMRESINNTVGLLFFIIYSIASSFRKLTLAKESAQHEYASESANHKLA